MLRSQTGDGRERREQESPLAEVAMLAQVVGRDKGAFEALYRCYHPRLRRFIERVTHRPQMVEEILNETMLVVWRKAHTYNRQSKVSTWIFGIAFRKALKALKRLDEPVEYDPAEDPGCVGPGLEGELMRKEVSAVVGRAVATLSAEHRAVVELTYYQGCGYREIAQILSCPVDTVKTRMFYARRRLRAVLADRLDDIA